jgi:hypothetical protein
MHLCDYCIEANPILNKTISHKLEFNCGICNKTIEYDRTICKVSYLMCDECIIKECMSMNKIDESKIKTSDGMNYDWTYVSSIINRLNDKHSVSTFGYDTYIFNVKDMLSNDNLTASKILWFDERLDSSGYLGQHFVVKFKNNIYASCHISRNQKTNKDYVSVTYTSKGIDVLFRVLKLYKTI